MKKILSSSYLILIFIFLYLPIVVLITFSFNDSTNQFMWSGFTLKWYTSLLENDELKTAMLTTISIAFVSTVISTIIGFFASVGIYYSSRRVRLVCQFFNNIPILNPDIVTGTALMILFVSVGIRFGAISMLLAHVMFSIPFVILAILPKLSQLDQDIVNAGRDLGLTSFQVLSKIILPLTKNGIISGALLAFTMSIDDFVISYFTTGNGVQNLSMWIYTQTRRGISPQANAVSAIMFVIVLILLVVSYTYEYRGSKRT